MESSWWDRGLILGGWAIAGLLALVALAGPLRGGGHEQTGSAPLVVARAEPGEPAQSSVEGAVQPSRSTPSLPAPATATPAPTSTAQTSLTRCGVLRTSPNWSPDDREWFLASCLAGGPAQVIAPSLPHLESDDPGGPAEEPSQPEPTAAAEPPAADANAAIALALHWLATEAPVTFTADASSCSAAPVGGRWIVTCRATLAGCTNVAVCERTISLCVSLEPPSVASAQDC